MPGADVSIYSLIRPQAPMMGPLDSYMQGMQAKNLVDESQLRAMQREQLQAQLEEDKAYRGAATESGGDLMKLRDLLFQRGAPKSAMSVEQQRIKAEKDAADLKRTKVETLGKQIAQMRDAVAGVQTDGDLAAVKELTVQMGGKTDDFPASVSDPAFKAWQAQKVMTADKLAERLKPHYQLANLGGTSKVVQVNPEAPGATTGELRHTMTPGEVASNSVARANLAIKGAEATPGGVFSIPDIVARAGGGGGASMAPAGTVTPSQVLAGRTNAQNALPVASGGAAAPVTSAPATGATAANPIQEAMASGATGDELLKKLPKQVADQVKMMVEGRMAPPTGFAASKPYWQGMLSLAAQYEPGFDETLWKSRQATRTNFASGTEGRNLTAINTAVGHLDSLDKAAQALNNGDYPLFNTVLNAVGPQVGATNLAGRIRTFEQAKEAVANELMRVFRGVGASSSDTQQWAKTISASGSPEELRASVKSAVELLESRIGALSEQYKKGMSTKNDVDVLNLVYPKARATLDRLKQDEPKGRKEPALGGGGGRGKPGGIKFLGFEENP